MIIEIEDFFETMLNFFPSAKEEYRRHMEDYGKRLDTVVIEDVFMPKVVDLLKKNMEIDKLKEIFGYFERVSMSADKNLLNIFFVTTLEILGNEVEVLGIAKQYMGPTTARLQREADIGLGRIIE